MVVNSWSRQDNCHVRDCQLAMEWDVRLSEAMKGFAGFVERMHFLSKLYVSELDWSEVDRDIDIL